MVIYGGGLLMSDMKKYNHISKLIREQEQKINNITTNEPDLSNVTSNRVQHQYETHEGFINATRNMSQQQMNSYAVSGSYIPQEAIGITSSVGPYTSSYSPMDTQEVSVDSVIKEMMKSDDYQLMKEGLGEKVPPAGYVWVMNPSTMMHELRKVRKPIPAVEDNLSERLRKLAGIRDKSEYTEVVIYRDPVTKAVELNPTSDDAFNAWLNDPTNRSLDEFCHGDAVVTQPKFTFVEKCVMRGKLFIRHPLGIPILGFGALITLLILIF